VADPALRAGKFVFLEPGNGDGTPFAADTVGSQMGLGINGNTGAAACADDDRMNNMRARSGAIGCLRNG